MSGPSWPIARLGDLVDVLDSRRVPLSAAERAKRLGRVPYYGAAGQVGWIDDALFDEDLLLLGEDGVQFFDPAKKKAYRVTGRTWVNNHAHVLRARPAVDWRYLEHYLNHFDYRGFANGTTRLKLTQGAMRQIPVALPPLDEQRRIVDILEDHLSRLDAGAALGNQAAARSASLLASVLNTGMRGQLAGPSADRGCAADCLPEGVVLEPGEVSDRGLWELPPDWCWTTLGRAFSVHVGTTPSRRDPSLWSGLIPWVSSGEVAFNRITHTRESIATPTNPNRVHPAGTVMLAMIGEGKTRGQAAILGTAAAHNQNCASIRVEKTAVLPEWVYYFLRDRYLVTRRSASGGNQPALNKRLIEAIPMPVAPLNVQTHLVGIFEAQEATTARLRQDWARTEARVSGLRRALLAAAFSGRLTGRSSDLELAEELIDA